MCRIYIFAYFLIYFFSFTETYGRFDRICAKNREACDEILKNATYSCTDETESNIDCYLNMNTETENGNSRLAIMEPEESLLASALVSERIVVIGTVSREVQPYQTVVIIRKPYNSFESLRGKRFCHPGYIHDESVTRYVLDEFESKIISLNKSFCNEDENVTVAERNVKVISNFFISCCKPGPWTTDNDLDIKWKSTYSNLCDMCGPQKCAVEYKDPFNDTLTCLKQNSGDVALTTLRNAKILFNESINADNFQYLCPNGTVSSELNPCIWTNQLHPLIVTQKNVAEFSQDYLRTHLQNHIFKVATQTSITKSLEKVFGLQEADGITLLENPIPLKTFVETYRSIPSIEANSAGCNQTLKWCTLNDNEQLKCMWLRQAALNFGLQPSIECVQNNEGVSCVTDIQSEQADFAFVSTSYSYLAEQNGLAAVAYPEDLEEQLVSVLIVIRNDTSDINHLKDLKGKRACFPEYGGKEWLAFIDAMRNSGLMPISCDYGKIFGDFVGSSCIPGAKSPMYGNDIDVSEKLCTQCVPISNRLTARYCNADEGNKYYTSDGSLRCLKDRNADYAVISVNEVTPSSDNSVYRVLCKNGSLARIPGLLVDKEAPLIVIASGQIAVKNESTKKEDISLLLRDVATQFGDKPSATFSAFGEFDGVKNVLLPEAILGLTFGGDVSKYVKNVEALLENSTKCIVPVSGSGTSYNVVLSTVLLLIGFFVVRF